MSTPDSRVIPFSTAAAGRRNALSAEALLAHYNPGLRRYLFRSLSAPEDVEDIVQEVCCRALQDGRLTTLDNPGAFLYRMAHNILVDRYRKQRFEQHIQDDRLQDAADSRQGEAGAESLLQYHEMTMAYQQALKDLPKKCRQVFLMRRHDGLSNAEIAENLNISMRMVQKQMVRAMAHFRDRLC